MKKSTAFIICILLVLCCGFLAADEAVKEGDATMCPAGLFPDRGYYGASDSFAVGSIVKVTNKSNSKSVDVYIVDKCNLLEVHQFHHNYNHILYKHNPSYLLFQVLV